jgi:hypothetical protein
LAVTGKVDAATIPVKTREAVVARDLGDRWPGAQSPPEHCDIHHIRERAHGGTHDPDNLACNTRSPHVQVHDCGWDVRLTPDTGATPASRPSRPHTSACG